MNKFASIIVVFISTSLISLVVLFFLALTYSPCLQGQCPDSFQQKQFADYLIYVVISLPIIATTIASFLAIKKGKNESTD